MCIDLIFNRIWCSPILHRSCHRQMIHAKFNLDIVYPPPYEREREILYYQMANIDLVKRELNEFD